MIFSAYSGLKLLEYIKKKHPTFQFLPDLEKAGVFYEKLWICELGSFYAFSCPLIQETDEYTYKKASLQVDKLKVL